uniref:Putative secreted protein n=1 Tax=Anopheles marajoara TaxID=58244 RepID=A0A2M4CAQ2_9DIPT
MHLRVLFQVLSMVRTHCKTICIRAWKCMHHVWHKLKEVQEPIQLPTVMMSIILLHNIASHFRRLHQQKQEVAAMAVVHRNRLFK